MLVSVAPLPETLAFNTPVTVTLLAKVASWFKSNVKAVLAVLVRSTKLPVVSPVTSMDVELVVPADIMLIFNTYINLFYRYTYGFAATAQVWPDGTVTVTPLATASGLNETATVLIGIV